MKKPYPHRPIMSLILALAVFMLCAMPSTGGISSAFAESSEEQEAVDKFFLAVLAKEAYEMTAPVPKADLEVLLPEDYNKALDWHDKVLNSQPLTARVWSLSELASADTTALQMQQAVKDAILKADESLNALATVGILQSLNGDNSYQCPSTSMGGMLYAAELMSGDEVIAVSIAWLNSYGMVETFSSPIIGTDSFDLYTAWKIRSGLDYLFEVIQPYGDSPYEANDQFIQTADKAGQLSSDQASLLFNLNLYDPNPADLFSAIPILERITNLPYPDPIKADIFSGVLNRDDERLSISTPANSQTTTLQEIATSLSTRMYMLVHNAETRTRSVPDELRMDYFQRNLALSGTIQRVFFFPKDKLTQYYETMFPAADPDKALSSNQILGLVENTPTAIVAYYVGKFAQVATSYQQMSSAAVLSDAKEGVYFLYYSDTDLQSCVCLTAIKSESGCWDLHLFPIYGNMPYEVDIPAEGVMGDYYWITEGEELSPANW